MASRPPRRRGGDALFKKFLVLRKDAALLGCLAWPPCAVRQCGLKNATLPPPERFPAKRLPIRVKKTR
jgi:hypothetical protein